MSHAGKWLDRFVIQEQFLSIPTQLELILEISHEQRKGLTLKIKKLTNDTFSFQDVRQISFEDQIWIETNPDYLGNFNLVFILKAKNSESILDRERLTFMVNKENIAPYYDIKRHTNNLFSASLLREGISVFKVVAYFYTHSSEEKLGMAVLLNSQETVANWEIKAPNSEWQSLINDQQEERLDFDVEQIYKPINICQYLLTKQQEQQAKLRLIPSDFSIRIKETNSTYPLSLEEASKLPRLIFTAWDMTETWPGDILHLAHSTCEKTFSATRSLSPMLSFMYGVEYDCSNGPVIHTALKFDNCGVCGGDGTSCLDCRDILHGASPHSQKELYTVITPRMTTWYINCSIRLLKPARLIFCMYKDSTVVT
ncbi:uncharacterized protein LOC143227415 [Tachypleus tridentatus]|uniref:uncharacterized protein LOC143227415 n=1 Tax=Tachypleus tridentatus TaxID=6853 RepID=UPI003FD3DEF0